MTRNFVVHDHRAPVIETARRTGLERDGVCEFEAVARAHERAVVPVAAGVLQPDAPPSVRAPVEDAAVIRERYRRFDVRRWRIRNCTGGGIRRRRALNRDHQQYRDCGCSTQCRFDGVHRSLQPPSPVSESDPLFGPIHARTHDTSQAMNPIDERMHPVRDEPAWSESYYFNFVDPDTKLAMFTRMGFRPGDGWADGLHVVYLGGDRVAFTYGRRSIQK